MKCCIYYPHKEKDGEFSRFEEEINLNKAQSFTLGIDYIFNAIELNILHKYTVENSKQNKSIEILLRYKQLLKETESIYRDILGSIFDNSISDNFTLKATRQLCEKYVEVIKND